jgi:hypothetical protein
MIKRLTWFVGGAIAGAAGTGYAKRKVRAAAAQLAPSNVARTAADRARDRAHDLTEAVKEGRLAMRSKERELRARRDGATAGPRALEAAAVELVDADGNAVALAEPGRVIVLREVQDPTPPTASGRAARRR